jgi:hypothetical protein
LRTLVSGIGFTPPPLGPSPALIVVSGIGSSCGTASRSGSPRSRVRGVVRCLAPRRCSSSSLSPRLLSRLIYVFLRKVLHLSIRKEEGGGGIFILQNGLSMPTRVSKPVSLCWLVREWAMVTFFILGCWRWLWAWHFFKWHLIASLKN